ncbi:hypothetical protein [Solilutibacter tolerans]|uniref:hypothetical protein n=1 Tax=Solilutibacter tolerans TaxID=1604334 RepID=UPI0009713EF1|nr:hypothetical protein [Lysobacter tolerans]
MLATIALLGALLLLLVRCEFQPIPLSAVSRSEKSEQVIEVTIKSSDARIIKRREFYFSVVIINCSDPVNRYPAHPDIGGDTVGGFNFPIDSESVLITARVPAGIFDQYNDPCVFLEGGGYFSGTIKSKVVPVHQVLRTGPNNSFKPTPLRGAA